MKRRSNQAHEAPKQPGPSPVQPGGSATAGVPVKPAGHRRWWFRAMALLVPVLGLALAEAVLRWGGCGYETAFLVRHPAAGPDARVENPRFAWRFMPRTLARTPEPIRPLRPKPAGTCRVFVFGESAAIGDPAPAFGFSRILEVLLRDRYPGLRFEVVNVAFTAINSQVLLPIARDCQRRQGDLWLVYMGNNEVIGPFGPGTVFGGQSPPMAMVRAGLALKATRVGQCLDGGLQRWWQSREAAAGWGGLTMFLGQQVRRDDRRLEVVRARFQRNLQAMIRLGVEGGAQVVVSTLVANLEDWPPFASLHRADLTGPQRTEWERLYQAGVSAEAAGDLAGAARNYEAANRIDPEYAELHFRWGRVCLARGRFEDARGHFSLARDLDTLRLRADSRLNDLIRQTAGGAPDGRPSLVDAERAFDRQSVHGAAGEQWLYEHVHFNFAGNYLLARLFAEQAATLPPLAAQTARAGDWLTFEACAARLGYTDTQRYEVANVLRRRFEEPVYRQQLGYAERCDRWQRELTESRGASKPTARRRAVEVCRQALTLAPDDWVLHELTARLLGGLDDYAGAEAEWREAARLIPHAARPHSEIGKLLQQQSKTAEALAAFGKALEVNSDYVDAHVGLGVLYGQAGKRSEAIRHFRKALRLDPTKHEAAEALAKLGA